MADLSVHAQRSLDLRSEAMLESTSLRRNGIENTTACVCTEYSCSQVAQANHGGNIELQPLVFRLRREGCLCLDMRILDRVHSSQILNSFPTGGESLTWPIEIFVLLLVSFLKGP